MNEVIKTALEALKAWYGLTQESVSYNAPGTWGLRMTSAETELTKAARALFTGPNALDPSAPDAAPAATGDSTTGHEPGTWYAVRHMSVGSQLRGIIVLVDRSRADLIRRVNQQEQPVQLLFAPDFVFPAGTRFETAHFRTVPDGPKDDK